MAFGCPNCRGKTLSTRSAGVKVCLNCRKIVDKEGILNLLRKLGVGGETIEDVDSDLTAVEVASVL